MLFHSQHGRACPAFEARLEDYLDGRLEAANAAAVESHTRACSRCADALQSAAAATPLLAVLREDNPVAGPYFAGRVMAAIRGENKHEQEWKPVETAARRLCWVATALALILAVFMLRMQFAPPSLAVQQNQVQALINVPVPQPTTDDSFVLVASEDNGK